MNQKTQNSWMTSFGLTPAPTIKKTSGRIIAKPMHVAKKGKAYPTRKQRAVIISEIEKMVLANEHDREKIYQHLIDVDALPRKDTELMSAATIFNHISTVRTRLEWEPDTISKKILKLNEEGLKNKEIVAVLSTGIRYVQCVLHREKKRLKATGQKTVEIRYLTRDIK